MENSWNEVEVMHNRWFSNSASKSLSQSSDSQTLRFTQRACFPEPWNCDSVREAGAHKSAFRVSSCWATPVWQVRGPHYWVNTVWKNLCPCPPEYVLNKIFTAAVFMRVKWKQIPNDGMVKYTAVSSQSEWWMRKTTATEGQETVPLQESSLVYWLFWAESIEKTTNTRKERLIPNSLT